MLGNHFVTKRFQKRKYPLFNNRHFGYPETKITDFKISGTRLGTTLRYCRLILETETEPGMKSRSHYLWFAVVIYGKLKYSNQSVAQVLNNYCTK